MLSKSNIKKLKSSLKWSVKNWMTDHEKKRFTLTVKKKSRGNRFFFVERSFEPATLTLITKVYVMPTTVVMILTYSGKRAEREITLRAIDGLVITHQFVYMFPRNPSIQDLYKWVNAMVDYMLELKYGDKNGS